VHPAGRARYGSRISSPCAGGNAVGREYEAPRRERNATATRRSDAMRIDEIGQRQEHRRCQPEGHARGFNIRTSETSPHPADRCICAGFTRERRTGRAESIQAGPYRQVHTGRSIPRGSDDEAKGRVRKWPCGTVAMRYGHSGHWTNVTRNGTTYCLGCTRCLKGNSLSQGQQPPPAGTTWAG